MKGHCTCKRVTYELKRAPMFVNCCHCSWCQRETGSAFVINALIEADQVAVLTGRPEAVDTPSLSGVGQKIWRCPDCKVALWSNYGGAGDKIRFVRAGTLEEARQIQPDAHIFTTTKVPWVQLPAGVPVFEGYYDSSKLWPAEAFARRNKALGVT